MQEYREYLKYNLKYAGIWNIMEYNAHIPNIVDDFASDGPLGPSSPGIYGLIIVHKLAPPGLHLGLGGVYLKSIAYRCGGWSVSYTAS